MAATATFQGGQATKFEAHIKSWSRTFLTSPHSSSRH
jgi:hypothetical protein